MKSVLKKALLALFALILLVYVGYQAYLVAYEPYETTIVKESTYAKELTLNGFFVRDESVLESEYQGVVGYQYQTAEKVPAGAQVARIYENESDLYILDKIEDLKSQRSVLKEIQGSVGGDALKIDLVKRQLNDAKFALMRAADTGNFSNLDSLQTEILLCLNRYALCLGDDLQLDEAIQDLNREIESLQAQVPSSIGSVKTNKSGYFSSLTDGLEDTFTIGSIDTLTVSEAKAMLSKKGQSNTAAVGKVAYDNRWRFVAVVPQEDRDRFRVGRTTTLTFTASVVHSVRVTVEKIITEEGSSDVVVVFAGKDMDADFLTMRFEDPRVTVTSYSGIVIPKDAVRIRTTKDENGNTHSEKIVYAVVGKSARARKLSIVYEDENVIVSEATGQSDYVAAYDQVIIKGKELNDAQQ